MQKLLFFIFLTISFSFLSLGQDIKVSEEESYKAFVEQLKSSKDLRYQEIIALYDTYIENHPNDISVKLSKCKFIGTAYYDDYEDYDTNWEETDACKDQLLIEHPKNQEVLLYKLDDLYGEEKTTLINEIFDIYKEDTQQWSEKNKATLFKIAAYHYNDTELELSLLYADKAQRFDEELDLSLLKAQIYIELGEEEKAKEALDAGLYYDNEVWNLNQKGNLLVDLKEYDKALDIFERVKEKDSTYIDKESIYKILINNYKIEEARTYLVEDTISEWGKSASLQKLLNHDIQYSSKEIALISYKRMQEESYYEDFFGVKRIKIFFKDPFKSWSFIGLSHLIILLLLFIILFLTPYLWVMPVYGLGSYFKWKFNIKTYWNLKHLWGISFAYLLVQTLMVLFFYYENYMNLLFDVTANYFVEDGDEFATPNEMITFSVLLLIATIAFLNKRNLKYIFNSTWPFTKIAGISIVFFVFNIVLIRFIGTFTDISEATNYISALSLKEEIFLLINEKGFLITALIIAIFAPFYEEIIFRGIILNSVSKKIGFKSANVFQAILFALIHFNLPLFLFYFTFGIVTGVLSKRTNGLVAGMVFHFVNNFIVVIILYYAAQEAPNLF